jgi:mannosyltransferase OCH1-like enzyme
MADISADRLVAVYIKIRDAKEELTRNFNKQVEELDLQMDAVEQELLDMCKTLDASSIRTKHGLAMRSIKSRYTTNDWERFYAFMLEHKVPELLEKRIHQTNTKTFLEENPDLLPPGLNVDNAYSIIVRRST